MDCYSWNSAYYQLVFDFPRPAPQAKSWLSRKEYGNTFSRTRARSCSSSLGRRLRSTVSYSITKSELGFVGVDVWLNVNNVNQERNREVGWPAPLYEHSYPYPVHRPQDGFRPSHWKIRYLSPTDQNFSLQRMAFVARPPDSFSNQWRSWFDDDLGAKARRHR